ncbi:hypothetical protein DVR12_06620 [Chitinophaga silvatica]|uniref:HEPN domain-containing protein n=1 Tax=Chitinophaga silvatica TaxID=2282649 RepID=A0A3E1YEG6_9BACT|nr:hypothetical protein DVR12_06620 [Chitinophaga silvatica]
MSCLKIKSEINFNAARHLQMKYYYPSVVHCAYYSCIQLMRHVLIFNIGLSDRQMEEDRKEYYPSLGVHQYLIERLTLELQNGDCDWKKFHNEIEELRKLRTRSDYQDKVISENNSQRSIILCYSIINCLKTFFIQDSVKSI